MSEGSGEQSSLDNSVAIGNHAYPRNLGAVKVSLDLQTIKTWDSDVEIGSYNQLDEQSKRSINEGIVWLTDFKISESESL